MKKFLLLLTCLLAWSAANAEVKLNSSTKYRLSCKYYNTNGAGSVVLGSNHYSSAEIYYDTSSSYSDDSWWYIKSVNGNYVFVNAQSGQYLAFTTNRVSGQTKGLTLVSSNSGTDCEWTINEASDGYVYIQNVYAEGAVFNLRTDGTYLLGTYNSGGDDNNEHFKIYDEQGKDVTNGDGGDGGDGGNTDTDNDYLANTHGQNALGEYWERTHLSQPVVYTTNTSDPVLYSIINVRSGQYAMAQNSLLLQDEKADNRTQFYFVQSGTGTQIYTASDQYVSTNYSTNKAYSSSTNAALSLGSGSTSDNIWGITWGSAEESGITYSGYALQKLDNLSSSSNDGWGWGGYNSQSSYLYWNDYNKGSYGRMIGLYDLDAGSTFVFASSDLRHAAYLQEQGIDFNIDVKPTSLQGAVDSLILGGKELVYEATNKEYWAVLPESLREGGNYTTNFRYHLKPGYNTADYTFTLNGQTPDEDGNIILENVDCATLYPIVMSNADESVKFETNLRFTFLPIVEVNHANISQSYYNTGTIRVTDPTNSLGYDSLFIAAFKYRGASASNYPKKSYAIKLYDSEGNSVDRKFLGLRKDNNWILDAMYIDRACMRNRVATDLWNDFAVKPYYGDREKKVRTGTRGHFVEVFVNGKYHGLYCMTEKMDRKQLKLKKFVDATESASGVEEVHGLLYKSNSWSYETFMGHESDNNTMTYKTPSSYYNYLGSETWGSFEFKYPDYQDEAVDWSPLYNAVNFMATTRSQTSFDNNFEEYFDYPMMRDYYLFLDLLLATDNHGKNMYYYVYDLQGEEGGKLSLAPWDLDGTFGQDYYAITSKTSLASTDYDTYVQQNEHGQYTPFLRLKLSTKYNWMADLKARYAELRMAGLFSGEKIAERFATYAQLFADSHADEREQKKWKKYHTALQDGAAYAEDWIVKRIAALDTKYGFDSSLTNINEQVAESYFTAEGSQACIYINSGKPCTVRIYNTAGSLQRTLQAAQGLTIVSGFAPGIYIVNGVKVAVR